MEDPFSVLGLEVPDESEQLNERDVTRAYRKLALKWHPDKNPDNRESAQNMFMKIFVAYETLLDPEKRAQYITRKRAKTLSLKKHAQMDAKRKKMKEELDKRERDAALRKKQAKERQKVNVSRSELDEQMKKRLREEIERLREEWREERKKQKVVLKEKPSSFSLMSAENCVKVSWSTESTTTWTVEKVQNLFADSSATDVVISNNKKMAVIAFASEEKVNQVMATAGDLQSRYGISIRRLQSCKSERAQVNNNISFTDEPVMSHVFLPNDFDDKEMHQIRSKAAAGDKDASQEYEEKTLQRLREAAMKRKSSKTQI
eukprot:jgi/Galph1/801/GphlegSOOS_G5444.1